MAKLLLNADGKVLMGNDKVLKAPEGVNVMKTLLDGRKEASNLFKYYTGTSVDDLIKYDDTENVTNMEYMFGGCYNLQSVPLLDTSKVTDMEYMFNYCGVITIPQLDTSKVTNMSGMFAYCNNLQSVPQLDTSKVTNMFYMFYQCSKLQTISQLDTSNVTDMTQMFYQCSKLKSIDITSLDKVRSASYMNAFAYNCYSLTKLIIRNMTKTPPLNTASFTNCYHFTGTVNSTYNPEGLKDGRIYIPDEYVEQIKQATNWSAYADIIVPLSTLQEE